MNDSLTGDTQIKRGRGRPPNIKPDETGFDGEDVTYIPGREDPPIAKWRGYEFMANVPLKIMDRDLIESARGNRFFRVGDQAPSGALNEPPKTSMQYRAHVLAWINAISTIDEMAKRWSADARLRTECEVGDDDIAWLGTLVEPRLHKMRMEAGLKEVDVAKIFVKHGVTQLPWRS